MEFLNSMKKGMFYSLMAILFVFTIISCENDTVQPPIEYNSIAGVISDEADMSVPFAIVQIVDENAGKTAKISGETILATDTTDEDGNFSLNDLPLDISTFKLRVLHMDFGQVSQSLATIMKDKDKKKLPVTILHDTNCKGRIEIIVKSKKDSSLLIEAEVRINRGRDVIRKTWTNSEGKIVFENVCAGSYWVRIAKTGYKVIETDDGFGVEGEANIVKTLYMSPLEVDTCCNGIITIGVKDANDLLMSGVLMKLYKEGKMLSSYTTEANGAISFRNLCKGVYHITLFKAGFYSQEIDVELDCNDTVKYDRTMLQDSCCNGRVLLTLKDTSGAPAFAVNLWLYKEGNLLGEMKTNDLGQYLFTGMCEGVYKILAKREGLKPLEYSFSVTCNDSMNIEKTMYPVEPDTCCDGVIKIKVIDDATRDAINGGTVKIWKDAKLLGSQSIVDGWVTFTKLCKGRYAFDIIREGYTHREFAIELGCNQTLELEKAIVKETPKDSCCQGMIKVIVRNGKGEAMNGATVRLYSGGKLFKTATVEGGYAYFKELCKGLYAISITKDGYNENEFQIELGCNETKAIEKNLVSKTADSCCRGQYTVYLKDSATGRPIAEAMVYLWKGSTKLRYLKTDADGKVTFNEMCEGEYSISTSRTGYNGREWVFRIGCNETLSTEKSLLAKEVPDTCCTAAIKVKVIDSTEARIAEVKVIVYKGDDAIADPRTNAEGWALVEKLCVPPNRYVVVVSKDGYITQEFAVEFSSCITQQKVIILKKR